jgi:hypothetical protein
MAETVSADVSSHQVKWGSFILRGIVALIIGFAIIFWSGLAVEVVTILFGVLLIITSVQALYLAHRTPKGMPKPMGPIVLGVVGLIAGIIAVLFPWITAVALTLFIAVFMVIIGFVDIATAVFHPEFTRHRYSLGLTGAVAVILGGIYFFFPVLGAMVLVIVYFGFFAILYGIMSIAVGFMVKGAAKKMVA